tara:strand:+ start:525 stop:794 length:270 start_codon:yes stop_codon:yes gene_type:complete
VLEQYDKGVIMPKGMNDFAVQESVAPYTKAVVAIVNTEVSACRAIYMIADTAPVLTINGVAVTFTGLKAGQIYPLCVTKSNSANVIFLY